MRFVYFEDPINENVVTNIRQMCMLREKAHLQKDYKPKGNEETIVPGTYYLTEIDDMFRRKYEIKA